MPGIERLLLKLAAEPRVALGLLTGNLVDGAELKLRSAGIDTRQFVVGAYGSDSHDRAELPAIAAARARPLFGHVPSGEEVVIIGDTPADIACGRGIGARAIAVATGAYTVDELAAHDPWALVPDLSDTDAVMSAILA
jgi:phosphoglycolate phosphatase-like HAD superfamily hydrolase